MCVSSRALVVAAVPLHDIRPAPPLLSPASASDIRAYYFLPNRGLFPNSAFGRALPDLVAVVFSCILRTPTFSGGMRILSCLSVWALRYSMNTARSLPVFYIPITASRSLFFANSLRTFKELLVPWEAYIFWAPTSRTNVHVFARHGSALHQNSPQSNLNREPPEPPSHTFYQPFSWDANSALRADAEATSPEIITSILRGFGESVPLSRIRDSATSIPSDSEWSPGGECAPVEL
ncbi:hypothetical protein C8R46DRAFT_432840 [Mycena filopes]|nr:hypothetical protein C8R46DRAFT_432840 [Mycena filopes]